MGGLPARSGGFRIAIVEPGERELALREASRCYAEDATSANLAALEGAPSERTEGLAVPPLAAYADLPDWTERHLPGRIVLAGRALRSLKSARFEDVALVGRAVALLGRAVALLGTTYHRMKSEGGMELREAFEDALHEL